jgi:hypothetical protein
LALAATLFTVVTLVLRVLSAARGNLTTAQAIVQKADLLQATLAVWIDVVAILPTAVGGIISLYLADRSLVARAAGDREADERLFGWAMRAQGIGLLLSSVLTTSTVIALVAAVAGVVEIGAVPLHRKWDRRRVERRLGQLPAPDDPSHPESMERLRKQSTKAIDAYRQYRRFASLQLALVVLWIYVTAVLSGNVWLPAESIMLTNQSKPVVGYVIGDASGVLRILRDRDRKLIEVQSSTVEARHICRIAVDESAVVLFRFKEQPPKYPACGRG